MVDQVKEKHDAKYTPMQYCVWGELIVGGEHVSMDEAPDNNSMFNHAGDGTKTKPKDVQSPVAQELAEVLTLALAPRLPTGHTQGSRSSPAQLRIGQVCIGSFLSCKL